MLSILYITSQKLSNSRLCEHIIIVDICDNYINMEQRRPYKEPLSLHRHNEQVIRISDEWTSVGMCDQGVGAVWVSKITISNCLYSHRHQRS